jgi:serine/threonine-protein kinase
MGVVWKAHDGKLDRDVAVKILPAEFSEDKQRLARFEREAKLLAALNHPNIASIHGLEEADGTHFLVLELVPGHSLAEALKAGPMPVEEALDICRQVAEGLEAAHESGVIHRDLKPGNVRVTPDGKAKVLDFGLAKDLGGEGAGSVSGGSATDLSHSPTVAAGTQAGVILGTAPYGRWRSPERRCRTSSRPSSKATRTGRCCRRGRRHGYGT